MTKFFLTLAMVGAGLMTAKADAPKFRLPAIISDNMVLQDGAKANVWGWGDPGETVTVTIAGQTKKVQVGSDGKWSLKLDPFNANGSSYDMTVNEKDVTAIVKNVMVGEVWVCSGQSNMEFGMPGLLPDQLKVEVPAANYPDIRYFKVDLVNALKPTSDFSGSWKICTPENVTSYSAVAYFFGRRLFENLHKPIGLIASFRGATYAEQWTSREGLAADPDLKPVVNRLDAGESAGKSYGNPATNEPATCFYNGMISPILPYTIRGVIWYQGEGNSPKGYQYRKLLAALIHDWRGRWGEGNFPFLFVQLPNYQEPGSPDWYPELRDSQFAVYKSEPNTGMAVTIDVGEQHQIHPQDKLDVGIRLANWALAKTYDKKDLVYSGPLYEGSAVEDGKIRIKFTETGSGLNSKDGGPLKYFTIAGEDHKWMPADATIDGTTVVVSSKDVPKPVAVRYAWLSWPEAVNFYNKEGLPAAPFRTDDWPGVTHDLK